MDRWWPSRYSVRAGGVSMKARMFLAAVLLCSALVPAATMQSGGCDPAGNVRFICGVISPEDLVAVPRSDWVVASGYAGGAVHLINTRTYATTQVFPTPKPRERFDK